MASDCLRCSTSLSPLWRPPLPAPQRSAVAVAHVKEGKGVLRVNGVPLHLVEPEPLRAKVLEPVLLLGADRFNALDVRVRVRGGGFSSQVYGEQHFLDWCWALGGGLERCGNRGNRLVCLPLATPHSPRVPFHPTRRSHPSGDRQGRCVVLPEV